jgi:hypothetical protein
VVMPATMTATWATPTRTTAVEAAADLAGAVALAGAAGVVVVPDLVSTAAVRAAASTAVVRVGVAQVAVMVAGITTERTALRIDPTKAWRMRRAFCFQHRHAFLSTFIKVNKRTALTVGGA